MIGMVTGMIIMMVNVAGTITGITVTGMVVTEMICVVLDTLKYD